MVCFLIPQLCTPSFLIQAFFFSLKHRGQYDFSLFYCHTESLLKILSTESLTYPIVLMPLHVNKEAQPTDFHESWQRARLALLTMGTPPFHHQFHILTREDWFSSISFFLPPVTIPLVPPIVFCTQSDSSFPLFKPSKL